MINLTTSASTPKIYNETDFLERICPYAFDKHFSVAVWQLPGERKRHVLISKENQKVKREIPLEELQEGFIFAPFDRNEDAVFLRADYVFSFEEGVLAKPESDAENMLLNELLRFIPEKEHKPYTLGNSPTQDSSREKFIACASAGIKEIEKGNLEKIVPSRTHTVALTSGFSLVKNYRKLCDAFPNAMVSFVTTPETGTWMGATPELLVCVRDDMFKTVALAGTQPYHEGINLKSVAWTQKEIEEQALVERYIISCFKKIRLREYDEQGPKTVVAGNLMHLRSDFTVDMKETNFPQLGSVMLQLLHPTSAVCGVPLEPSVAFLQEHEGYHRKYYAGYLGPVNIQNQIHIFVNLRCLQIADQHAIIYAGAGVTSDSIPEKEWEETEMKINSLHQALVP